ncbi:MAG: pilus assembly protein TadG-related protein, partial [Bdellovibrionota bacterium]
MRIYHFKKRSSERAVAVVYFALIFSFLMGFLMLAANTGRLVYHKMKLQSSVDLAAYAGASVQAAYLGSESPDSIKQINAKIMDHYIDLLAK